MNDNPKARKYVLAPHPDIWSANLSDVASPKPMAIDEWLTYLMSTQGRTAMFHFELEGGHVVGIEERYYP